MSRHGIAVLSMLVATLSGTGERSSAEPDAELQQWDHHRPIRQWIDDLTQSDPVVHDQAFEVCYAISWTIAFAEIRERFQSLTWEDLDLVDDSTEVPEPEVVARWQSELTRLTPQLLNRLDQTSDDQDWTVLFALLVVADSDGEVVRREFPRLLTTPEKRAAGFSQYVHLRVYLAPRDESVLAPIVAQLKSLPAADREHLDKLWGYRVKLAEGVDVPVQDEFFSLGIAAAYYGAYLPCLMDRIHRELPQIAILIGPEFHPLIREAALSSIIALAEEAHPILSAVEQQLDDPDPFIRMAAGFALVTISPRDTNLEELAERLKLPNDQRAEFMGRAEELTLVSRMPVELDESMWEVCLKELRSQHQVRTRSALRMLLRSESPASFALADVQAVLRMENLDEETRRLAVLALKAIQPSAE